MAISIGGTVVIDDGRNIVNANDIRVGVVTITGSTGDIETPGTITVGGITLPLEIVSISPTNGATNVPVSQNIVITFNQVVGVATTGFITLRSGSAGGPGIQTFAASNITSSGPNTITINPPNNVIGFTTIFPVIPSDLILITGSSFIGLNTTGGDSYSFTTSAALGDSYEGGYLICLSSGVQWVVSPYSAEVSRTWYNRNDANTRAQQVSGCTGWFVPTCGQLQNPGYICRSFWGPSPCYTSAPYWSSDSPRSGSAWAVDMSTGGASSYTPGGSYLNMQCTCCVRAFRCVTY